MGNISVTMILFYSETNLICCIAFCLFIYVKTVIQMDEKICANEMHKS